MHPLRLTIEGGIDIGNRVQCRLRLAELLRRTWVSISLKRLQRARRRRDEPVAMAKAVTFGGRVPFLLGVRTRGLDLCELEPKQVEVALAATLTLTQLFELGPDSPHRLVRLAVLAPPLQVLGPGKPVEHLELCRGQRELAVLVLAVEPQQLPTEGTQVRSGSRTALDEGAGSARRRDSAAQDDLLGVLREALGELGEPGIIQKRRRQCEDALDVGLGRSRSDDLRTGTTTHQEVQRVGEDGLPGTGLAGDGVESTAEPKLGSFDQQEVLDPKLVDHRRLDSGDRGRIRHEIPASGASSSPWAT